ncbi:MAG: GPP34 family phosphoprotein [Propionibacteriaceae bacterium]|nr:GPP34 family phosphoprotein [Propionibacteriaceae bacterium]
MTALLIAEDLLLLLTDDVKGTVRSSDQADLMLGGALLAELSLAGRLRITEHGETHYRPNRVVVVNPAPTDDPILDGALARLSKKPDYKPQKAVELLAKDLRRPLQERLVARGLLRHERSGFLGLNRWPAADPNHEAMVRAGLFRVLVQNEEPTVHLATLIALLSALKVVDKVIAEDVSTIDKRAVRQRAEELRKQNWTSEAVRAAIKAAEAAAIVMASSAVAIANS